MCGPTRSAIAPSANGATDSAMQIAYVVRDSASSGCPPECATARAMPSGKCTALPSPHTASPTIASHGADASQNSANPAALTPSAPIRTAAGWYRRTSRPPTTRPTNIPPMIADTAAVAVPGATPAWVRSTSATHRFRHSSTEAVATRLVQASQYDRGNGRDAAGRVPGTDRAAGIRTRKAKPSNATRPSVTPRPGRQPRPAATAAPTASGATMPTAAATALASLIDAAPATPWWSLSTAAVPLTTPEPPIDASAAHASVAGNGCDSHSPTMPTATAPSPVQISQDRPNRRTVHGRSAPPTTPPTANAVPCRLATPRLVCCSSRSSGTTGPNP